MLGRRSGFMSRQKWAYAWAWLLPPLRPQKVTQHQVRVVRTEEQECRCHSKLNFTSSLTIPPLSNISSKFNIVKIPPSVVWLICCCCCCCLGGIYVFQLRNPELCRTHMNKSVSHSHSALLGCWENSWDVACKTQPALGRNMIYDYHIGQNALLTKGE